MGVPSASLNESNKGMYEPIHGSAPDIAGKNMANPLATILSVAMMCRYTLNMPEPADLIEDAVIKSLQQGARTQDIAQAGEKILSTAQMGDVVVQNLLDSLS